MLTDDERKRVFKIAVEECKGKVAVLGTTTGDYSEERVIELTKYANDIGMDGVMFHAPFRVINEREIIRFYKRISEVDIPMMIYNIPRKLPVNIHTSLMKKLVDEVENFVAVKEADRDLWTVSDKIKLIGDEVAVFVGPCPLILPGLQFGAVGYIATSPEFLEIKSFRSPLFQVVFRNDFFESSRQFYYGTVPSHTAATPDSTETDLILDVLKGLVFQFVHIHN